MKCKDCNYYDCQFRTTNAEQECLFSSVRGIEHSQVPVGYHFDWQSFRREAAKDMACAIVQSDMANGDGVEFAHNVAKAAVMFADELIKVLKEDKQ